MGTDSDVLPTGTEESQHSVTKSANLSAKTSKGKKPLTAEILLARRKKLWHAIIKKDIPKAAKARTSTRKEVMNNARKVRDDVLYSAVICSITNLTAIYETGHVSLCVFPF